MISLCENCIWSQQIDFGNDKPVYGDYKPIFCTKTHTKTCILITDQMLAKKWCDNFETKEINKMRSDIKNEKIERMSDDSRTVHGACIKKLYEEFAHKDSDNVKEDSEDKNADINPEIKTTKDEITKLQCESEIVEEDIAELQRENYIIRGELLKKYSHLVYLLEIKDIIK